MTRLAYSMIHAGQSGEVVSSDKHKSGREAFSLVQPCAALRGRTHLIRQHVGTEVLERQLQLLEVLVHRDLDGDEGVRRHAARIVRHLGGHVGDGRGVEGSRLHGEVVT